MLMKQLINSGNVHGVGYRRWFQQQVLALGLTGCVKNLVNGCVEVLFIGAEKQVEAMIHIVMKDLHRLKSVKLKSH